MKRLVAVAAVLLVSTDLASAQGVQNIVLRNSFNPVGAGARGLGMGGAFIAVADDGTAASFNPAGLAQLRRAELALVGFRDELQSTVTTPKREGDETSTRTDQHVRPDFAGLAVPFEVAGNNLTLQFSYQRTVDLFGSGEASIVSTGSLQDFDPDLPPFKVETIAKIAPEQAGAFNTLSVAAGYQVTQRLSFGAALNYWFADWTAQGQTDFRLRVFPTGQTRPIERPFFSSEFTQENSLTGFNLNLGLLLKYSWISVGGVVRLPFSGDYTLVEHNRTTIFVDPAGNALAQPVTEDADTTVTSQLHWPRSAGVGVAIRPFRGLTLAADFTKSEWSRTYIEAVPGGALLTPQQLDADGQPTDTFTDRNFFDLTPQPKTETRDTSQWRAGLEYLIVTSKLVFPLRGGIFRDRSPIVELGQNEGREIRGWTVGTGINFNRLVFDIAFERRESDGLVALRQSGDRASTAGASSESVRESRIVASLIYRAGGADDPLKRAFKFLFGGPEDPDEGKDEDD